MFLKSFGILAPVVLGGMYVSGAFGGGYSREVDRPRAEVMRSLADLDITKEPGEPGTDPSRSGGVTPMFVLDQTADTMTWKVMSGQQVATNMTAKFEAIDGDTRTRVTASVVRGDAPDDFVSPAFRSTGVTLGLFSMALETELDELTLPAGGSQAKCQAIMEEFEDDGMNRVLAQSRDPEQQRQQTDVQRIKQGFGDVSKTVMRLNAMDMKLRRAGCDTNNRSFEPVSNTMGAGSSGGGQSAESEGVSFQPGKPMVDVSDRNR